MQNRVPLQTLLTQMTNDFIDDDGADKLVEQAHHECESEDIESDPDTALARCRREAGDDTDGAQVGVSVSPS